MAAIGSLAIGLLPTASSSAELNAPHDCFNQPLDDKDDLTVVPIDQVNKDLEERARRLGSNATIVQWARTLKDKNNYTCKQHPESDVGHDGLEKRSVEKAPAPESKLTNVAKQGLRGACLRKVALRDLDLTNADLTGANLYKADLSNSDLHFAHLEGAILECANLTGTDLSGAFLQGASLKRTLLEIADLDADLDLTGALFEPRKLAQPENLTHLKGLDSLHFDDDKTGLEKLRTALRAGGMDDQDRQVRYSIITSELEIAGCVERIFSYTLFGITSGWGLYPWRPLIILVGVIFAFFPVYLRQICRGDATNSTIRRIPPTKDGQDVAGSRTCREKIFIAFYFSVLSSFRTKLSELDPGVVLRRMQPSDYTLQATGWLRLVSGLQSVLSFYLLALWFLAYVGPEVKRLFE
jgi:Pentapeptide repeats (8 copies)